MARSLYKIENYKSPDWATGKLSWTPSRRLNLLVTPAVAIHKWSLPDVPSGYEISVKRIDLDGADLTGNKTRKLEFLLADAKDKGCDTVVTIGGVQSNHNRTTALAAAQVGLKCHIILVSKDTSMKPTDLGTNGNLLLDRLAGAKIVLHTTIDDKIDYPKILKDYVDALKCKDPGSKVYSIPMGGMSVAGEWGYIEAFQELIGQGVLQNFDDIVMCSGSGGMVGGIAVANYLTGGKLKVHGVTISTVKRAYDEIDRLVKEFGLHVSAREILNIFETGDGNAFRIASLDAEPIQATASIPDLDQYIKLSVKTGIPLDQTYNGPSIQGLLFQLKINPGQFRGKRILYIHSGGIFGLYDGTIDSALKRVPESNNVHSYSDIVQGCSKK